MNCHLRTCCAIVLIIAPLVARPARVMAADETAEQRFERLLAPALQEPARANWKELREAFAGTQAHQPYNTEITTELRRVVRQIGKVEPKESEAALRKIVERERYMRLDSLFLLMQFYEDNNQPDQARKFKGYVDAIIRVLDFPNGGKTMDRAVEVIYIDEEYMFLNGGKSKGQKHLMQDGHHFDILTAPADGDTPEHPLYFNIDLVWLGNPLEKELRAKVSEKKSK